MVKWFSYAEGITAAKGSDRPIFLYFYGPLCTICRKMEEKVFPRKEIAGYIGKKLVPIRVNIALQEKIANTYRVFASPVIFFLKPDGGKIDFAPGYIEPEVFMGMLRYVGDRFYEKMSYQEFREEERNKNPVPKEKD